MIERTVLAPPRPPMRYNGNKSQCVTDRIPSYTIINNKKKSYNSSQVISLIYAIRLLTVSSCFRSYKRPLSLWINLFRFHYLSITLFLYFNTYFIQGFHFYVSQFTNSSLNCLTCYAFISCDRVPINCPPTHKSTYLSTSLTILHLALQSRTHPRTTHLTPLAFLYIHLLTHLTTYVLSHLPT
jgi:hypothetical protein